MRSFIATSFHRRGTAAPTLSRLDQELQQCQHTTEAIDILRRTKPELCARLRTRFPSPLAEALTLKVLNLFLARYHFRARSVSLQSRPFGLIVDPSNVCQLACPGCVHSERSEAFELFDWPKGTLSENRFSALLKRYGPCAIGTLFYNYGEPLLNLNTPKLIRMAKSWLMRTTISTTLSVRRFDAEAYVESGLDFMGLSDRWRDAARLRALPTQWRPGAGSRQSSKAGGREAQAGQALSRTCVELPGV
ncbi:MAG: hypothetical protein ACLPWF_03920 [Bryobacteraceae bacterium]